MRTPPRREPVFAVPLALLAAATTLVLIAAGGRGATKPAGQADVSWKGLAGGQRPRVAVGQRVVVLLKSPSLAERVRGTGGLPTSEEERAWTRSALASQRLLISRLGAQGVAVQPEFTYTRVLNGFSAAFDANGLAVLERAPEVAGVYPVRAAYPAASKSGLLSAMAPRPELGLSNRDGRGITIALLDSGVDRAQPFLRGRVRRGIDIVGGSADAAAAAKPDDPGELERHGTEMAGLLVGYGGPGGLNGVAPGATLLPIRVAGWQRDAAAQWAVYGRTDQLLAGLERSVDPNADGDAHDAADVALVALAEPFAGFADGPIAQATQGATDLDTLVVAAAGNDGAKGPGFGSIAGPGGSPAALTVGAADLRARYGQARIVLRVGLTVELDRDQPLASAGLSGLPVDTAVAMPRRSSSAPQKLGSSVPLLDFFDPSGLSLVAGRAALVSVGSDPGATLENAARAGAAAVIFYGADLPAGGINLDQAAAIPAVSIPALTAEAIRQRLANGDPVTISIGKERVAVNGREDRVAEFSSTGLAFDGRVKPEIVAPGVVLGTSEPGANLDGSSRFGTVTGTSAAAAIVAGGAALLAQARPELDAETLKSVLVTSARPLADDEITAQGAGLVDVGGAAASEVAVAPSSLAFGRATGPGWTNQRTILLRNLSVRRLRLKSEIRVAREGAAAVEFSVRPGRIFLDPGQTAKLRMRARVTSPLDGLAPSEGALLLTPLAGRQVRVPWAIIFGPSLPAAISAVRLSSHSFAPSDAAPAFLTFVAGAVDRSGQRENVRPLSLLDLELWSPTGGRIGLLARLRDVLPGRYSFGVTGRDPTGQTLPSGPYTLRLVGYPTGGGPVGRSTIGFSIK